MPAQVGPILAVGIRGTLARPVWLEELGPMDPVLARRTDPNSLIALFGGKYIHFSNGLMDFLYFGGKYMNYSKWI